MAALKSMGKCVYCNELYSKSGIGRHLTTHLKKIEKENPTTKKAFHVQVPAAEMFLHLLISESTTFASFDDFLRQIWLECCGHLSAFNVKGKRYNNDWDSGEYGEKKSQKVGKVFKKGIKLEYDYDFGSTTRLEIKVVNSYKIAVPKGIALLSRNEPLPIMCQTCGKKPATEICSVHIYQGACLFCDTCAKKHAKSCDDFDDYAAMPVVNSPRMGVCAYDGGQIDQERDGIWKGEV